MAYGIVFEFTDEVDKSHYDAVNAQLGLDPGKRTGDWPAGLLSHAGGTTPTGFVVFEVWESKAQSEAWLAGRLGAALASVGVPAPTRLTDVDIAGYYTP
jgi:hypothetical protein